MFVFDVSIFWGKALFEILTINTYVCFDVSIFWGKALFEILTINIYVCKTFSQKTV